MDNASGALKTIDINQKFLEAHDRIQLLPELKELNERYILPCLIVIDINMPRMDGKQTFAAIKIIANFQKFLSSFLVRQAAYRTKLFLKGITLFCKTYKLC
jgi:CheY-like chemotaxis protein